MNYPFATPSPYMHAAMSQAVQAFIGGGHLPPNCVVMAMPFQQAQQILPQLMMSPGISGMDPMMYSPQAPYYGPSPYAVNPQARLPLPPPNYNYPVVPYKHNNNNTHNKKSKKNPQQPHPNIYNSSSFDSYMDNLSWSRLFDRPSRKNSKPQHPNQDQQQAVGAGGAVNDEKKSNSSKPQRSNSATSSTSSSTTSDETIRRVNVATKQSSNTNSKQQTKGSLPFKYSSEFVPGVIKQQPQPQPQPPPHPHSQRIKSNDVYILKKA